MSATYDVFLSHAWADGDRPQPARRRAHQAAGLRVWFDAAEINDFASITHAVTEGLAQSKALVAYYSKIYPLRRACQWEVTAAFLAAQTKAIRAVVCWLSIPRKRADHIHPIELRDAKFRADGSTDGDIYKSSRPSIVKHVAKLDGPAGRHLSAYRSHLVRHEPVGSTRFVGRLKEMWEVHSLLHRGDVTQITGAAAPRAASGRLGTGRSW